MKHISKYLIVFLLSYQIANAQTSSKKHIVKRGETVYQISQLYDVSVSSILDLNPDTTAVIRVGDVLILPDNATGVSDTNDLSTSNSSTNDDPIVYKIKSGDTKFSLARKYGVSIKELERQNPNIVRMLMKNDIIRITGATNKGYIASNVNTIVRAAYYSNPNNLSTYIVKPGDTKFGLAKRVFNTTISELEYLNPKIKTMLVVGQEILIPNTTAISEPIITETENTVTEEVFETPAEVESPIITEPETIEETVTETIENTTPTVDPPVVETEVTEPETIEETVTETIENTTPTVDPPVVETEVTEPETIEEIVTETIENTTPTVDLPAVETEVTEPETIEEIVTETIETTTPTVDPPVVETKITEPEITEETVTETIETTTPTIAPPAVETITPVVEPVVTVDTPSNIDDGKYIDYVVKQKETLYSLAQDASMSMQDFLLLNPKLLDVVETGMIIKMPRDYNNSSSTNSTSNDLLDSKYSDLSKSINATKIANVVMTLPFSESGFETYKNSSIDFHRVLDEHTKKHLEFYRGAKIAIDSLKSQGIRLNVTIHESSSEELNPNAQSDLDQNKAIVINPFYSTDKDANLGLISNKNALIVTGSSELSNKGFNNVFEAVPSTNAQRLKMLNYINNKNGNIILISDFVRKEIRTFISENTNDIKILDVKRNGTFVSQELIKRLDTERKNYIILDTERTNTFLSATNVLLTQLAKHDIQIVLLEKSLIPDSTKVSTKRFSILKMIFPSLSPPSKTLSYIKFINRYTREYGGKPPVNALIGFDITYDTVLRLSQSGAFNDTSNIITEYLALKFNYKQYASGNYYNDGIYILYYDTSDTLKEAN